MRLGLAEASFRRRAALIAGVTFLLATTAPASAYEPRWTFFPSWAARPAPDARVEPVYRRPVKPKKAGDAKVKEGKIPPGPQHIIISIKRQRLTLYANGEPVAHSPVSTGVPGHPTPLGVFSVIQKNRHHRSNIYSDAPMPFMQRITWSGVALHEGRLPGYPASHGCIRLPAAFAQRLWGITRLGARVIIAQDDVALADIRHMRLFAPKPALVSDAPAAGDKIRLATASLTDAPLKGSIDANDNAAIESAIDKAAQEGIAGIEGYPDGDATADATVKFALGESPKDPMLRPGPISVYISRKTSRLYVRKGFIEVFEAPVTIAQPDRPLGTHVFTALNARDGMRWSVASLPTERVVKKGKYATTMVRGEILRTELAPPEHEVTPPGNPNEALDRITIPDDALARITELVTPGASLIISDLGLSYETGNGTDFIVLTR